MAVSDQTVSALPDVGSPLSIDTETSIQWDESADVVVIGFGGAGACTAIEARERGADVIVIDRFNGGGATRISGGVCYAGGTRFQREAGFDDTSEEMYKYLRLEAGDAVSDKTLRRFCEESNANLEWLETHGVPFSSAAYTEKTAMPPEGKFLYYSGNEKVPEYSVHSKPAPRGHRAVGKGLWTGYVFFAALEEAARKAGVRVMCHTPVTRLITDHGGRVIGVEVNVMSQTDIKEHQMLHYRVDPLRPFGNARAEKAITQCNELESRSGERRIIHARRGVILATGGFEYNVPMLRQFLPSAAAHYDAFVRAGTMGSYGSGVKLGQSVGGATRKMDSKLIACFMAPPDSQLEGIVVNREGRRFINEDTYAGFLGNAINAQPDEKAWLILDSKTFWKTIRQVFTLRSGGDGQFIQFKLPAFVNILLGGTKRAYTLERLAEKCGINRENLFDEVNRLNSLVGNGQVDPLGKNEKYLKSIDAAPYYAINKSSSNKYNFGFFSTLGGLEVDGDTGAVLNTEGSPIPGLYAAGRTAVGVCSHTYFSGLSLADLVFSGRRAGRQLTPQDT